MQLHLMWWRVAAIGAKMVGVSRAGNEKRRVPGYRPEGIG